ncbi:MAG: hypothetical protein IPG43_11470 [Proteobacteria bacterium]|nr:hypothetical protein [Pseudomonadota bacterium]
MTLAISRALGALTLLTFAMGAPAEAPSAAQDQAARFATCAAFYFNAVNVKPMKEYEEVYGAGERAFNEGIKLVGRKALDDLMARSAGDMTKLMNSDWKNFHTVERRYGPDCATLMATVPAE